MKILIVRTGGTEMNPASYNLQEVGLARSLLKRGHSCDIVYYTKGDRRVQNIECEGGSVKLYWLPARVVAGDALFDGIDEMAKSYDVIQVSEYDRLQSVALYRKYPNVVVYHGPYKQKIDSLHTFAHRGKEILFDLLHTRKKLNRDVVLLSKSTLATDLLERRGFRGVRTVGVGLDVSKFDAAANPAPVSRKFNLLMVGRLHPNKNTLFALDVLERCLKLEEDINLFLIGKGEGEYADKVLKRIDDEPLAGHVTYIESIAQADIAPYYLTADAYLLPSVYEIFGMVLLEAAYFGCPYVASATGGALTMASKGEAGVVLDDFDVQVWADAIVGLLHDETRRGEMAVSAKELLQTCFTWDAIADEFLAAYERAAARR